MDSVLFYPSNWVQHLLLAVDFSWREIVFGNGETVSGTLIQNVESGSRMEFGGSTVENSKRRSISSWSEDGEIFSGVCLGPKISRRFVGDEKSLNSRLAWKSSSCGTTELCTLVEGICVILSWSGIQCHIVP